MSETNNTNSSGSFVPPRPGGEGSPSAEGGAAVSYYQQSAGQGGTSQPQSQPASPQPTQPQPGVPVTPQPGAPQPGAPVPPFQGHAAVRGPQKPHGVGHVFWFGFLGAAIACIIGIGGFAIWQATTHHDGSASTQLGATTSTPINAQSQDTTTPEAVASKDLPSVAAVDVYTKQAGRSSVFGGAGAGAGSDAGTLVESSLGSGVVLNKDGYIITNNHVVEGADALKVTVGGSTYDAKVVGTDPSSDIAVVKVDGAKNLTPIELGDSDKLTTGEWVMSIGSPFGLEQSVATGVVSATSRSQIMDNKSQQGGSGQVTIYPNMIQTDAAINPGNSGGALVDKDGKLIGINTLITSYSGNYSGVGFAIPVNYAVNIAQQIIDGKTPTHAQLGVSLTTVNAQNAQRYGLPTTSGAYIATVNAGSGAESAGLKVGDIITKFDDKAVNSASDLMIDVRSKNPGDKVTLEVNSGGSSKQVQVTLGSDEATQKALAQQQQQQKSSQESLLDKLFNGQQQQGSQNVS